MQIGCIASSGVAFQQGKLYRDSLAIQNKLVS